ncbi:MAG TPA: phage minor capsid protein [Candidatus Saccharimonadales bacterium]|nr:phage minor capsid protein [Candidatus Saccharimonadales bacterium]
MALFPKRVDIDEASIRELVDMYDHAARYVRNTIFEVGRRKVTVVSVQQARALIAQRLTQLTQESSLWAERQMTTLYNQGQQDAVDELRSFHDPRTDAVAAAIVASGLRLHALHQEAAQALVSELQTRLRDAAATMDRSASKTLGQLLRESVTARMNEEAGVATRQQLRRSVLQAFDDNGVSALYDAAGKRWSPSVYADMVSRTLSAQARNGGMMNSLKSQGYDLVRVSAHGAGDACREWEDSILSMTGATPGYFTVSDATGAGLFHVNCQHSLDPVDPADYPPDYLPDNLTEDQFQVLADNAIDE